MEDVVNHEVTPHGEADIQPAGEEDGQLGVTEGAPVAPLLGRGQFNSPKLGQFRKGLQIGACVGATPEVGELLLEVLGGLRHVDIAILPEDDGEAVEVVGDYLVVMAGRAAMRCVVGEVRREQEAPSSSAQTKAYPLPGPCLSVLNLHLPALFPQLGEPPPAATVCGRSAFVPSRELGLFRFALSPCFPFG